MSKTYNIGNGNFNNNSNIDFSTNKKITSKDKKEMKNICNFGFHEKDGSPHVCKVNCECEFATFGICNEDGSYGYGDYIILY